MKKFCYWSISWGEYDYMLQALVNSAKRVGIEEDFITFTEKPIQNCINYRLDPSIDLDRLQFFKFEYLYKKMLSMDYKYFIFIDADHFFLRHPEISIEDIMKNSPWHSFLESPLNSKQTQRQDWWSVPNQFMCQMMKNHGVQNKEIRNTNGGFWICHRDFITRAVHLAYNFHNAFRSHNIELPEEVSIGYLSNLISTKNTDRFSENFTNYWASDWTGIFQDALPIDKEWESTSYMTYEKILVKPAIIHAMRSKNILKKIGKNFIEKTNHKEKL